jgi:hypothetical protein
MRIRKLDPGSKESTDPSDKYAIDIFDFDSDKIDVSYVSDSSDTVGACEMACLALMDWLSQCSTNKDFYWNAGYKQNHPEDPFKEAFLLPYIKLFTTSNSSLEDFYSVFEFLSPKEKFDYTFNAVYSELRNFKDDARPINPSMYA